MTALPDNHLARIANFFDSKLEELRFHLENIVEICDESRKLFESGKPQVNGVGRLLVYSFSSYTNTIQSLKDTAGVLIPNTLSWEKIKALRHGSFMKDVRNAITHDGNPVISAWADGRYFVPNKIVRLEYEKVVVIDPPALDVRQFCLEFSADFAKLLSETLKEIPQDDRLSTSILDIKELDEVFRDSSLIPEFAKQLHVEQREKILEDLKNVKTPHIETAIKRADELAAYCAAKLAETAASAA